MQKQTNKQTFSSAQYIIKLINKIVIIVLSHMKDGFFIVINQPIEVNLKSLPCLTYSFTVYINSFAENLQESLVLILK